MRELCNLLLAFHPMSRFSQPAFAFLDCWRPPHAGRPSEARLELIHCPGHPRLSRGTKWGTLLRPAQECQEPSDLLYQIQVFVLSVWTFCLSRSDSKPCEQLVYAAHCELLRGLPIMQFAQHAAILSGGVGLVNCRLYLGSSSSSTLQSLPSNQRPSASSCSSLQVLARLPRCCTCQRWCVAPRFFVCTGCS